MKKRISSSQIMNFAQVILYKVLPCPEKECLNCPRDVVIKNQYKDYEYECPFYHGEKDKRRLVMTSSINEEFIYKANYAGEKNNNTADKEKCSLNYFESMFHPLYYKMFRCKREYCNFSLCCPFFHSEDEKKAWDRTFSNYIRKDRIDYVKEKQRYLEGTNPYALNKVNTSAPQKKQPQEGPVRFFRSGAKPAETNDKESTCTSNETSSPLSGYSGFSSQKDDEKHHQKNLEEPIFAQPSQNDEGNGSGNGNGKGFKSNFFYKGKNWNRNQFQYVYVKSNENEIDTPSTGTSTDRKTNNYWRNSKKPMY